MMRALILEFVKDFGISPEEINNGGCADFATALWIATKGEASVCNNEELGGGEYLHSFVKYKGKYYDAECPDGVQEWRDLPYFQSILDR